MSKVLWLPSWYPSETQPYSGDFIERHAKAVAGCTPLQVIFAVKKSNLSYGKIEIEERKYSDESGAWIYYYGLGKLPVLLHPLFSFYFKIKLFARAYKKFYSLFGKPSFLHLHVVTEHAWVAWWLCVAKKIPLIVSEHWAGFLPEAPEKWNELSFFQRVCIKKIFDRALFLTTVSQYLLTHIREKYDLKIPAAVIPNTVDTNIFKHSESIARIGFPQFIHISILNRQKNFSEIIEACALVKQQGYQFRLNVFAPSENVFKKQIIDEGLEDVIFFKKELPQEMLAKEMAKADALILYSLYETFGCVLIEANACGVPAIISDIKVFEENSINNITAVKVPLHQPALLAACMIDFIKGGNAKFEKEKMTAFAKENYSMERVGKMFFELYRNEIFNKRV